MKKKLEAELISIAHRILKLKNKSELVQLHQETQKLYEKLSVLRFVEENFADVKPTIGYSEMEEKIETAFENDTAVANVTQPEITTEPTEISHNAEPLAQAETPEEHVSDAEEEITEEKETAEAETENSEDDETTAESVSETESETTEAIEETPVAENLEENAKDPIAETESPEEQVSPVEEQETLEGEKSENVENAESKTHKSDDSLFKPSFELAFDPKENPDVDAFKTPEQTSLEDFLHDNYVDPVFVTPEDLQKEKQQKEEEEKRAQTAPSYGSSFETAPKSLNDRMSKGIIIGLNDRIAFMNHLFNNSSEDYNRVLSQLMTIDTFEEAKDFIDSMVKPDYNNWAGKDEYAQRFMEIVEKKFS